MSDASKTKKKAEEAPAGELSFEQALARLEGIVVHLERGDLPLEDSLTAYEEGIGLVRKAQAQLDSMDRRLEQLLADGRTVPLVVEERGAGDDAAAPSTPGAPVRRP